MLTANQMRAAGLLSLGSDVTTVASTLNVCRATIARWKKNPEFQRALNKEIGTMMGSMVEQVQTQAREFIEASLDAVRELRRIVLSDYAKDQVKRLACRDILHYQQRFLDMLGFNANLKNRRNLACDEMEELEDVADLPDCLPRQTPLEPGDGLEHKSPTELKPDDPRFSRGFAPRVADEFSNNPIFDDETKPEEEAHHKRELERARASEADLAQRDSQSEFKDPREEPYDPSQDDNNPNESST